jgi:hypothetical protein
MPVLECVMTKQWNEAYLRVASGCPTVTVADVAANVAAIAELYDTAVADACAVLVCPELSLTGYALGDLVLHAGLREAACAGLLQLGSGCAGVKGPLGELATCRVDPPAGETGEATAESP